MKGSGKLYMVAVFIVVVIFAIFQLSEPAYHMLKIPPHIRQLFWIFFIFSAIILLVIYLQPLLKATEPNAAQEGILKGRVLDYHTNRIGDIDKLLIETKQQKIWIHFPPHTANMVMKAAAKGEQAEIYTRVSAKRTLDNLPMPDLISIRNGAASFLVESVIAPAPAVGKKVEISGKPGRYKLDEKGLVAGIIIDHYLIDISPHLVQNLFPVIKDSEQIIVKGYERNAGDGFVNITGLTMIKPYAISIDKTDYLL